MGAVVMFETLVPGALCNLSDDQIEYQLRDRLSFMRVLGLGLEDRMPDAKTVWRCREWLARAGMVEALFGQFDGDLARQGYIARGGQILGAAIVPVPKNHNTRDENKAIKAGAEPEGWADKPAIRSQKDTDARRTRKHGKSHCGCKNHANLDRRHKPVRRCHMRDAARHGSQAVDQLLMRGKPLTEQGKSSNRTRSALRARVEHVFGAQMNDMGGTLVRSIGPVRAKARTGMKNLACSMRRLAQLRRLNPFPA